MKKLILFLLFSCTSDLKIDYNDEGVTQTVKTDSYTKTLYRYQKDDEKVISKVDTHYNDIEKGRIIDYYLVVSISENNIYQRITNKNKEWIKNYHNIGSFLTSVRNLKAEVENEKFKNVILAEEKDELEKNNKYTGKRYEINRVAIEMPGNSTIKEIVFKNKLNDEEKEVIRISYQRIENKEEIFVKEKEIEKYFVVKATIRNAEKEVIGIYYHFYDIADKDVELNELLPFADNPKDIKLTLVRNKDLTSNEKIKVSNNFRIAYNGNTETLKGKDEKTFYENIADSSNKIENILSFYTILDKKEFLKNFANKEGIND